MENIDKTNCYFCHQPMTLYEQANWRDGNYYCNICPKVPYKSIYNAPIWASPCIISIDKKTGKLTSAHLFWRSYNCRLSAYYDETPNLELTTDRDGTTVFNINACADLLSMSEETIEKKLKTWITFS